MLPVVHIGMPMALTLVHYGAADREPAPLTFPSSRRRMVNNDDVAIIGIGLHAFGRTPACRAGAGRRGGSRRAEDAGLRWDRSALPTAAAGCRHADALCNDPRLTGVPFINVANGCATAAVRWPACRGHPLGMA